MLDAILVVDDDPMMLEVLIEIFDGLPCEIIPAESLQLALDLLDKHRTSIRVVVTDLRLSSSHGSEIIEMATNDLKVPTICISGTPPVAPLPDCVEFFLKPFDPKTLIQRVESNLPTRT